MVLNIALFMAVVLLAYSNGANDNFKGVATLFGSGATGYGKALAWATLTTFAGSILSLELAGGLVKNFSGNGLVPAGVAVSPVFLLAAALGTGATVLLATSTGFPVSTTHALTGALLGSGFAFVGTGVNFSKIGKIFFLPLAFSPLAALALAALLYPVFTRLRQALGIGKETCVCVAPAPAIAAAEPGSRLSYLVPARPRLILDRNDACAREYGGRILGIPSQSFLDAGHFLSAGMVSFARGLNDTPKLMALLTASALLGMHANLWTVALGMAVGGLLNARKVAVTLSRKITPMNPGQGFTANLVTAGFVTLASRFGLPVSTTHVSVGAISGIGMVSGRGDLRVLGRILLSWILTLPIGALLGYLTVAAVGGAG